MCDWTITPRNPQSDKNPVFDPSFEAHMRGRQGGSQHSGLHTLNGIELYEIENNHTVPDGTCPAIFSAKVRLGSKDKYDHVTWDDYKLSTFFPTTMCLDHVKVAVIAAYKNYYGLKNSTDPGHKINFTKETERVMATNTNVKWTGKVKITSNEGSFEVWVGSLQTGDGHANRLYNAFPAINRRFA